MKKIVLALLMLFSWLTNAQDKESINSLLDQWHQDASQAKYTAYFDVLAEDAIFIGTDAVENWTKSDFQAFAKPYFDSKKTWHFKSIERHIYFSSDKKTAWFDELLDTQMKICRGSGVLEWVNSTWKIKQYVLSIAIPNKFTNEVVKIKASYEDALMVTIKNKP